MAESASQRKQSFSNGLNLGHNQTLPLIMHIDLNSCFATIEQQSRPLLRGRPVVVVNRLVENTSVITVSYEAKAYGVKAGMKYRQAKRLCPELAALDSDPPKYRWVYRQLLRIMNSYSPAVVMKSIDEGIIDFAVAPESMRSRGLEAIGKEIKQRLRTEVGSYMRCNIGISTNRFWAKMAASLHKPDGLDVVTAQNVLTVLASLTLRDLTGIARHNEQRLNAVGIFTPLQMYESPPEALHAAFHSINGEKWYQRLHGWEVDDLISDVKTCGRQYVLEERNMPRQQIAARLHNLVEAVGQKLRSQRKSARGVGIYVRMAGVGSSSKLSSNNGRWGRAGNYWQRKYLAPLPMFSDAALWRVAEELFCQAPAGDIREIGVHCYNLYNSTSDQLSLFGDELARERQTTWAIDEINQRYGARTIHAASTLNTEAVRTKIPFGSTRYL